MAIHGTVPIAKERITAEQLMEKIARIASKMIGEENAIRAADIMENQFSLQHRGTDKSLRKAMKVLLRRKRIPIISNVKGFFVARNRAELLKYRENLVARSVGLKRNLDAIDEIMKQADIHEYLNKDVQPRKVVQQALHYREM